MCGFEQLAHPRLHRNLLICYDANEARQAGFIRPRISCCFLARQLLDIKMNLDMNTYVLLRVGLGRQNELD